MEIKDRFKAVRQHLQMTQKDFAMMLGSQVLTVSRYENGMRLPGVDFLIALRKRIHLDINWLLTGDGSMFGDSDLPNVSEPEPSYGIAVGDQVQLAIGGPDMVVIAAGGGCVTCAWHDSTGAMCREELPTSVVRKV
jgi:transcriptional regulator with XRE-family HTH domain